MTYDEAQAYIASLAPRGWRLGLDRMQALVERAGLTDSLGAPGGPNFVHVAGTNGKGSVTAYLQSLLVEHGYRTGAFFSPYVFDPRERVQLGREMIPKEDLARLTEELIPIAESFTHTEFGGVTEFEFKTAVGFLYWKQERCEWVALEVGLGGRLDATNVVMPRACVIVSIGLDHMSVLGHTIEEIAFEKAGIVKSGVPLIVGELPPEALKVIEREAELNGCSVWRYGKEIVVRDQCVSTPCRTYGPLAAGIPGPMQLHNLALAVGALDAIRALRGNDPVQQGAAKAKVPGRFQIMEWRGRRWLLDGAHNPDAAKALAQGMSGTDLSSVVMVTNMVSGHEPAAFYAELARLVRSAHVVPIAFHRAMDPAVVAEGMRTLIPKARAHANMERGMEAALLETEPGDTILVTGSFYLVGEIGRAIGLSGR